MEGLVIDVAAYAITDIESESLRFWCLSEMLLFIANVMFATSNDPRALDALDGLGELNAGQDRIRAISQSVNHGLST